MTLTAKVGRAIAGIVQLIPGAASVAVGLLPLACIVYLLFMVVSCTWNHVAHSPAERRVMQLEHALEMDYRVARSTETCFEVEASGRYMPPTEQCRAKTPAERAADWQQYQKTSAELDNARAALQREQKNSR